MVRRNPTGPKPPLSGPHGVPGQTPPIIPPRPATNAGGYSPVSYGQQGLQTGIAKVGQARNQPGFVPLGQRPGGTPGYPGGNGNPAPRPPLPPTGGGGAPGATQPLSSGVQQAFQDYLNGPQYGVNAIPQGDPSVVRRFLKNAQAAGIGNKGLKSFLDPTFYRGMNDPYGKEGLYKYANQQNDPALFKSLAEFANSNTVTRATPSMNGAPSVQSLLGDAVPGLSAQYLAQAHPNGPLVFDTGRQNFIQAGQATPGAAYSVQDQAIIDAWAQSGGNWDAFTKATGITPQFRNGGSASPTNATDPTQLASRSSYGMAPEAAAMYDANTQAALARGQAQGGVPLPPPAGPHGMPGQTPPIVPGQTVPTPQGSGMYTMTPGGQQHIAGGPSTAGSTALGQNANNRPANPAMQPYGQNGQKMGVPKAQQARNQPGFQPGGGGQPGGAAGGAPGSTAGFLPSTPAYEAGQRTLEDNLAAQLAQIGVAQDQIPAYLAMMTGRAGTDQTYATQSLMGNMADRGIYDSGITPYLNTRDIGIPYGRQAQDLALSADQQYADLASQQGQAYLGYDQGLANLLLQRAQDVASQMPLSLPQYKTKPKARRRKKG